VIPNGTEAGLMASRQPKISFYYSSVSLAAGSLLFRDLKTISTLGGAAAGMAKLSALGKTNDEIMTFLQPIAVDLHMIGNPYANYNYYLSSVMVPGLIMLFIFLITPYSIGTELKFNRARDWMRMANNNPYLAIAGKMLPQTLIFLSIFLLFEFYIYYVLEFPHPGGAAPIILLGILSVLSCQCFGMACSALKQLIADADWGELDYFILDTPPGTSDIHLTLLQTLAITGAVIVSTPQQVALADARKGIDMYQNDKVNVPILGLIENMAYFTPAELPENKYYIFGKEGCKNLAKEMNVPLLAQIPIVQSICEGGDDGAPAATKVDSITGQAFLSLAQSIVTVVNRRNAEKAPTKIVSTHK
jgi:hypothetical protein